MVKEKEKKRIPLTGRRGEEERGLLETGQRGEKKWVATNSSLGQERGGQKKESKGDIHE